MLGTLRRRLLVLLVAVALPQAALANELESPTAKLGVCEKMATVFFVVAKYKQLGDTKEKQLEWVGDAFPKAKSAEHRRVLRRAMDFVYASKASPEGVRTQLENSCHLNRKGQVVLVLPAVDRGGEADAR